MLLLILMLRPRCDLFEGLRSTELPGRGCRIYQVDRRRAAHPGLAAGQMTGGDVFICNVLLPPIFVQKIRVPRLTVSCFSFPVFYEHTNKRQGTTQQLRVETNLTNGIRLSRVLRIILLSGLPLRRKSQPLVDVGIFLFQIHSMRILVHLIEKCVA